MHMENKGEVSPTAFSRYFQVQDYLIMETKGFLWRKRRNEANVTERALLDEV